MFFQPGSWGADSLAFDWGLENCLACSADIFDSSRPYAFLYCQSRGVLLSHSGLRPCSGHILFGKTARSRVLSWIFCSFKMGAMFFSNGRTKKLVLARLPLVLQCCF